MEPSYLVTEGYLWRLSEGPTLRLHHAGYILSLRSAGRAQIRQAADTAIGQVADIPTERWVPGRAR
jgi:hypothetical protein